MEQEKETISPEKYKALLEENRRLLEQDAEQKLELARLRKESAFDPITGLLKTQGEGRRKILESIQSKHQSGKKIALVRIDVNDLKPWNEEFGHEDTDDIVLSDLGRKLSEWANKRDGLAMRFHFKGDEFGILLPITNKDEVAPTIQELDNFFLESPKGEIPCSFTIGFAHEDEVEVRKEMSQLDQKGNELSGEGRLFTALRRVADSREREEERRKKER